MTGTYHFMQQPQVILLYCQQTTVMDQYMVT